ncbi:orotidine 5'-phosphate decarboxylase [Corynebacterium sp. CCM 9185]|uniref:Orotidine 5'-phosphate decarboxylase n=1 Tax=Corynebacterium marambiense TaxID=2765364 RepID=A0ABS0VWE4_9CORY|nr:orotidine 5'-phosphate decarboxylase / HUMPS family protein [Corynebacterium marambiense]MBI9000681.1 orotidine 5'-phosphate decarboxylase [Corynebacterium marambiense]MCK7663056.1 orotidine 5'-phosphate decarboxylase [Corynebacterium marambiense]
MRPQLQVAVDSLDMVSALGPLNKAVEHVDVIECGTILVIAEGLRAVREIRALYPGKTILADVRIAEAGSLIARQCFEAGADWVSCVAGASLATIEQVVKVAREYDGQVQVELGETYSADRARFWRDLGVQHVIVKRSRDREAAGDLSWGDADIQRVSELAEMGFTVTVTGGIKASELGVFTGRPVGVVIAGREIMKAADPKASALNLQHAISQVWP